MALPVERDALVLEQNRRRLVKQFEREVRKYEARYELKSSEVRNALREGRLRETAEVAAWLLLLVALAALARDHLNPPHVE